MWCETPRQRSKRAEAWLHSGYKRCSIVIRLWKRSHSLQFCSRSRFLFSHLCHRILSRIYWWLFLSPPPGIVSLISLAVLSYERYCTMMAPTIASGREYRPALGGICFSWLYSVAWTVPPLLGWSRYGPEGPGTTCSVDWRTQTPNNISYIVCLFIFCLVLPFCVILYSYSKLLHTIRQVGLCTALTESVS